MGDLGFVALLLAFALAVYAVVAALAGARLGHAPLVRSARNAVLGVGGLVALAAAVLAAAFVRHDFSLRYVAEHSSREMPLSLTVAAFYSGQQGSLLYWCLGLSLLSALVVWANRHRYRALMPYVMAVLMGIDGFFLCLLNFVASPFEKLPYPLADGVGLNPLLYDRGMLIHPPMLLAGYMSWSIPFAFAIAALATGDVAGQWIRAMRRWALLAWGILGLGNLLGAWWAYHVLGWGGYWGWDPVENSAIMPWLTGTAFIHSILIQERRGMLKVWNMVLILVTFFMSIFGTFIVRSGVITSVHSFAQSSIGPYFLVMVALVSLGPAALLLYRLPLLRSDQQMASLLSREASFLLNNLLLVGVAFATFWGTIYPLVSEALRGLRVTVGAPFYNQVNAPILLALLALMGVGPLLPWRTASRRELWASLWPPLAVAAVALAVVLGAGLRQPYALLAFPLCAFVAATIVAEFARGVAARRRSAREPWPLALAQLLRRNSHRYGGYVVHLGLLCLALGITASQNYQVEQVVTLRRGQSVTIGRYTLTYNGLVERREPGVVGTEALVLYHVNGPPGFSAQSSRGELRPERRIFRNFEQQPTTAVAIHSSLLDDLYVVLAGQEDDGSASFALFVNPMVAWLWIGGVVVLAGTVLVQWPEPRALPERARRPVRGGLGLVAETAEATLARA